MQGRELGINSKLVHGTYHPDATGAVNVPIYQSSTFAFRRRGAGIGDGLADHRSTP